MLKPVQITSYTDQNTLKKNPTQKTKQTKKTRNKNLRKEKHTKKKGDIRLNSQTKFHYYYCYHLSRTFKPVLMFLPFEFVTLTVTFSTVVLLLKLSLLKVSLSILFLVRFESAKQSISCPWWDEPTLDMRRLCQH